MPVTIRLAAAGDAAGVAAIYAPYCESTSVSFETTAPTADEMAARIATVERECPWLVLDVDGRIAGYAYASRHRERAAYKWAVDTAVYIVRIAPNTAPIPISAAMPKPTVRISVDSWRDCCA